MKSFVVLGLGRFGQSLARALCQLGHEVLVIDEDEESVAKVADEVTHAVVGDCTDEKLLKSLGVRNFDVAVVAIGGDLQSSILVTVILNEMGVKKIVAKAQSELHARILKKVGADRVVFPERDMGIRVAQSLSSARVLDYIEISEEYNIAEVEAPKDWNGKTLKELDVRSKLGINVMAIKRQDEINIAPSGSDMVMEGDVLVVIGRNEDIDRIK